MKGQQKFLAAMADARRLTASALDAAIAGPTKLWLPLAEERTLEERGESNRGLEAELGRTSTQ